MANEVGSAISNDFLPVALANGTFLPAPVPHIGGKGLAHIQEAMDVSKKGVSAMEVVVTL
jgi:hypothetical protein